MSKRCFLSIDPGVSGCGFAIYEEEGKDWFEVEWVSNKKPFEEQQEWYNKWNEHAVCCWIEEVQGRGGWSAQNNFSFGRAYQMSIDATSILTCPVSYVKPKDWQKDYDLIGGHKGKTDKKNRHKEKVEELFNLHGFSPSHRTADAWLICWWGRSKHLGVDCGLY